jgi:hypothetical protein
MAFAASVTASAYALAVRDEARQQQFKYTEFWMAPSSDGARLVIGVHSAEARSQRFEVEISVAGRPFAMFRSLSMRPGDVWTHDIPIPPSAGSQRAEARLYRVDDKRLYRSVSALTPGQ